MQTNAAKNRSGKKSVQPQIRLLVVDDNALFLATLIRHLTHDERLTVIGTATNAQDGLRLTRDLCPDILIVDIRMPGASGLELISWIRGQEPNVCIIAMTLYSDDAFKRAAIKRGAHAFIKKDDLALELNSLIHELYETGCVARNANIR